MKKKALALAVASALIAPSAFAASDTSGMQYTSASEGFYGSIRARYTTSKSTDSGARIENASSRVGVGGTSDLGGGLTGFYTWELGTDIADGSDVNVRIGNVGLRGDFGEISTGSFWTFDYSATHGSTDQANTHSGFFNYTADRPGRISKAFQYTTPDFNGFQSALLFSFDNSGQAGAVDAVTESNAVTTAGSRAPAVAGADAKVATKDENDLDSWNLAGSYAVQGFTLGGSYNVRPDQLSKNVLGDAVVIAANGTSNVSEITSSKTDAKAWTIRGSYAQDNWNVNAWYGQDNTSDRGINGKGDVDVITALANAPAVVGTKTVEAVASGAAQRSARDAKLAKAEDTTFLAFHAGVAVDKVNLYAIHEIKENANKDEDVFTTLGVQYNLGARSRTWLEYTAQDYDSDTTLEDYINIGLRFDF